MKFTVNKEEFEKALLPVSIIAQSKAADSTLSGIYVEAASGSVTLYCYDIEKGLRTGVPAVVESDGSIIADAQIVSIVRSLPEGDVTFSVESGNIIALSAGDAEFQVVGRDGDAYPKMPEIKGHTAFTVTKKQMKNLITKTFFSICKDDTKPILKGSHFVIKDNTLTVCAVDGFRFAVRKESNAADNPGVDVSFVLPGRAEQNLLRLLDDSDDEINIELSNRHVVMSFDDMVLIVRLLEGEFPNYEKFIPEYTTAVTVNRDAFIESLERVAIVNEKMHSSARLRFAEDKLRISCETENGKVNDLIAVHMDGEPIEVLFNQNFLLDALRVCDNEAVCLHIASGGRGTVICATPEDEKKQPDSYYLYLVMPIRSR